MRLPIAAVTLLLASCGQRVLVGDDRSGARDAQVRGPDAVGDGSIEIATCTANDGAGLDATQIAALRDAAIDETITIRYPTDGTVFPRGLAAPVVSWRANGAASAALVVLEGASVRYEACVSTTSDRLELPPALWQAAERAAQRGDGALSLRVSLAQAGAAVGAFTRNLTVSRTAVSGSVFYQVYGGKIGAIGSASVARLPLGGVAERLPTTLGCAGCHSVAVEGARLTLNQNGLGASFPLSGANIGLNSAPISGAPGVEWAAITPDGSVYVAPGAPTDGTVFGPRSQGASPQRSAGLFRTENGESLGARGLPAGAMMPAFSRDGARLVFNDFEARAGHGLSVMTYDAQSRTFADKAEIYASDTAVFPAWPAFLPDGRVLFVEGAASVGANGAGITLGTLEPPPSSLELLDLASGARATLLNVDGSAEDERARIYYPTVIGWDIAEHTFVCFDSFRRYLSDDRLRGLWCAALSPLDPEQPDADVSHPAFFLPGQDESATGFRPVAVRETN